VLIAKSWIFFSTSRACKIQDSAAKGHHFDLVGDVDEDILLPLVDKNEVTDWKGGIRLEIGLVLLEYDVSPGFIKIYGCHSEMK
jgi:hypothetical protein